MQWTVPQIIRELANLDTQMLSWCQRAMMQPGCEENKLVRVHNWIQAGTDLISTILMEAHNMNAPLHARS